MLEQLLSEIRDCTICKDLLPHSPRPIVTGTESSKIVIIGQAPGRKVHESGVPWDDKSGELLRSWLDIAKEQFYDRSLVALVPMGFCYPGKGKSGDLPPRPECALHWHDRVISELKSVKLTILIGQYAQKHYLKDRFKGTLTESVRSFEEFMPDCFLLPHPSPRNRIWLKKNPWFEIELLPRLQKVVSSTIG